MTGARKRKMRAFSVLFILPEGNFFNICVISMYSVLNTLSEFSKKKITLCNFLLVYKIVESLQCILNVVMDLFDEHEKLKSWSVFKMEYHAMEYHRSMEKKQDFNKQN